jgi:hypothetical protein
VVTKGLLGKVVKPSSLNVTPELAIPRRPVVFEEPSAKLRQLRWGERLDLLLDLLNFTHDSSTGCPILSSLSGRGAEALFCWLTLPLTREQPTEPQAREGERRVERHVSHAAL